MNINCNTCGKKRNLSKLNEERMLKENNNDAELLQENYICRKCKAKKRTETKVEEKEVKKEEKKSNKKL